jgi:hypothetical protein
LHYYPVSRAVSNARNDDPRLVAPLEAGSGQGSEMRPGQATPQDSLF